MFEEVLSQAAVKASESIRDSEQKLAEEFRKLGKDGGRGRSRRRSARPLCRCDNDPGAGAGWSQAEYDALQALK